MTDTPDDIQRQTDQLEVMRGVLDAAIIDDAIAKLQAKLPTQADPKPSTHGIVEVAGNYSGHNTGMNQGTVQQFFGSQQPVDGTKLL